MSAPPFFAVPGAIGRESGLAGSAQGRHRGGGGTASLADDALSASAQGKDPNFGKS